jgi:hypothetical protein
MDEVPRRSLEPLDDSHCQSHPDCESRHPNALHLILSAAEFLRKLLLGEPAFAPMRIHTFGQRREIPAESLIASGCGQRRGVPPDRWSGQKTLGRSAEPSEDEECVLACAIATFGDASQSGCADRMIPTMVVQDARLIPYLSRHLPPTESALGPPRVHRRIQSQCVELTRRGAFLNAGLVSKETPFSSQHDQRSRPKVVRALNRPFL